MNPCKVVGLGSVTWKCNWNCKHCYFRRVPEFHTSVDAPLSHLKQEIDAGKDRGCDSVVLCGKGEPTLHNQIEDIIDYVSKIGMKSLIITNGSIGIEKYRKLYDLGLNHLQVSMHGLGEMLDKIAERKGAGQRQMELLEWLNKENLPFRINVTLQQLNYREIIDIIKKAIQLGAFHVSFLNFLPHYHWKHRVKEIAVDPKLLVEPLEKVMSWLEKEGTFFTFRYFPMCLLSPHFWRYVTNTRFVIFDPWEWEYGYYSKDIESVWKVAINMGKSSRIKGEPCNSCLLKEHCGGWNRFYAGAFGLEQLKIIREAPSEYKDVINKRGGLFDLNPANSLKGYVD